MARKYKQRKAVKKDWVTEELDRYYKSKGIAQSIRNTPVDWSRYNENVDPSIVYDKYNIRQFTNKDQFRKYYLEKGLVDDRVDLKERERLLNKMWNDYVKREQLIMTGQYEEIRTKQFKDNYIKALEAIGVPAYYIEKLSSATLEEWQKMAIIPNTDKTSSEDKKLPHLGGFAYSTKGDNERAYDMEKILGDVIKAAREAGIDIADLSEDIDVSAGERLKQEKEHEIIRLKNVIRFIPSEFKETVYEGYTAEDVYERALSTIPVKTRSGRLRARISKKGNIYIPFIGSQGSPKSRRLLTDIITEFERRGLSLSDIVEGWDDR